MNKNGGCLEFIIIAVVFMWIINALFGANLFEPILNVVAYLFIILAIINYVILRGGRN